MVDSLYLIAHKCRGEATFDVAIRTEIAGEEAWITNTGHRAYPYWTEELSICVRDWIDISTMPIPDYAVDFFAANDRPIRSQTKARAGDNGRALLSSLGLAKAPSINRRV